VVSPVVLANARMLGASQRQLLRHVYLPNATSGVFSSLHTSVGLALVGAVVGEYLLVGAGRGLPDPASQGSFDIDTVMAGILVVTGFALLLDALVGGRGGAQPDEVAASRGAKANACNGARSASPGLQAELQPAVIPPSGLKQSAGDRGAGRRGYTACLELP
jgi:hypothetical protein